MSEAEEWTLVHYLSIGIFHPFGFVQRDLKAYSRKGDVYLLVHGPINQRLCPQKYHFTTLSNPP